MIQTYKETTKDNLLLIELKASLDNGWSVSEHYEIPIPNLNNEDFQTEKRYKVAAMYERFLANLVKCILKPQVEGTLPPTEDNSKPIFIKNN